MNKKKNKNEELFSLDDEQLTRSLLTDSKKLDLSEKPGATSNLNLLFDADNMDVDENIALDNQNNNII